MKAIAPTINRNSQGEEVTNLQDGLLLLLRRQLIRVSDEDRRFFEEGLIREQQAQRYDDITQKLVSVFQEQNRLQITGEVDQPTADALNRLLQGLSAIEQSSIWTIQGQITDALQRGLSEHLILVSEYDLDAITQISESRSNADGRFEFTFDYNEKLQDSDRPTAPDLIFSISDPNGAEKKISAIFIIDNQQETNVPRLADSDEAPIVLMNAPQNLKIRISVALTQRPITEFEELIARLSPFMGQMAFIDLKEDRTNFQISFLNKESGLSKEKIIQLRDAFVREREADIIPAWVFFGLASQQITFNALGSMEIAQLVQVLVPLQPSSDRENLEEIAIRLKQFINRQTIQAKIADLKDSVGDLLQPILNSAEKLESFLDAYARHDGAIKSFWQTMSQNEQFQQDIPRIQLNLQLSQLTLNNKGLVSALQQRDISNTRQLVDLSTGDWEALSLAHVAEIPPHITGENDLERSRLYAQELQILVEIAFPTEVIKKTLPQVEVNTFLNNNPEFDFTRTPVDVYLHEQGEQVFQGIDNPGAVTNQLQHIQRIYTLTANAKDTQLLMEMNFESAHQISKLSPDDFIQRLSGQISAETAYTYHAKAISVSDATVMLYHQMRDLVTTVSPKAAQNLAGAPNALQNLPANWNNLFGSIDFCECKHCKSVYSPSAYFVDLLNILLGQNNGKAREELFRRRPDLKHTKLSCEHTETLIPYIDLVNEVLETYVAQRDVGNPEASNHAASSTNDTSGFTASELAANPQHPNDNSNNDAKRAYSLLKEAIFPLNLPFDMDLETARQFLLEQNSSRFELMATFGDSNSNATAAERLGISKREFEILTLKQFDGISDAEKEPGSILSVSDLWGNPTVLKKITTFLDQTGITYIELIGLLKTRFLNQYFPIIESLQGLSEADRAALLTTRAEGDQDIQLVIVLGIDPKSPCDLSTTELLHLNNQPLTDNELSLFNRFIRLWKKLGCSISDLDGWLTAFGATDITPQVIQDISGLWQVIKALDLSFERSAVLVGNIPAISKDSLYTKLFLNKSILQIDNIFRLNASQRELKVSESLELHIPGILAALKISQDDFNRIVAYVGLDIATDLVNIANLSKVYRYVVFAKGLKMSIKDLVLWLGITNQAPWRNVAELVNVQELLIKLQTYDFKAAEFAYIFQDVNVSGNTLLLNDDLIQPSAKTLREGLLKIQQENSLKDGETIIDFLQKELGILLEPEEVSKVISILNGSNSPRYNFNDLLNLKTLAQYENILQDYLTPLDVNDLAGTTNVLERSLKYWEKFAAKLLPLLKATFVKQHLTATFKTEANTINFLLQDASILQACLDLEQDIPATIQAYRTIYLLLHKCLWLVGQFKLTATELTYFQDNPNFDTFNWKSFTFSTWLRLADYAKLRDALPLAPKDLLAIFEISQNGGDVKTVIVDTTGWDATNVRDFVDRRRTSDFVNEIALIDLQKQIILSQKIGVSLEKLTSWSSDVFLSDQAKDIKRSLKAKYDETAWVEVSTQIYNRLRSHLRDTLVAFLLQKPEIKIIDLKNTNDLYGYFLIDVEMDACMQTSRLKQAISSVQLFVQRCLLNLESLKSKPEEKILPSAIDANQWKWMKNYRVWEANRKVFLYPENWIEPELRDNKSSFFKELESELLQGEITNESAEKALTSYLEKLHDVSRLDICGMYEDTEAQNLHVLGRNFNMPPQYFYRQFSIKTKIWSGWQRVQADIQGDAFALAVWNGRLYLFWLVQIQTKDKSQTKLAWSERFQEKWTPKKISKKSANFGADRLYVKVDDFKLEIFAVSNPKWESSSLSKVFGTPSIDEIVLVWNEFGKFSLESCNGDVSIHEEDKKIRSTKKDEYIEFSLQSNVSSSGLSVLSNKAEYPNYDVILGNALSTNELITQEQLYRLKGSQPFFYQDQYRSYHVEVKKDWLEDTFPSIRNPWKATISTLPYRLNTVKDIDKSASFDTINRFDQLSSTVHNRFVESGQIGTSTAMQIRSVQTFSVPFSKQIQEGNLLVGAGKIGEIYFKQPSILTKVLFKPFFHAYVCSFMKALNQGGIEGLLAINNQKLTDLQIEWTAGGIAGGQIPGGVTNTFKQVYRPQNTVSTPYPLEDVDFSLSGAYSQYNWELFFHIPMLLANRLSKNQRFEEAMRWYHFVFNPTTNESLSSTARYWQVLPFRSTPKDTLNEILEQLKYKQGDPNRKELEDAISAWRNNPFNPHLIARMRLIAYQKNSVMKYLDNLIAWADNLFRQDTIESINQATQLYILAAELLGKQPEKIPALGNIQVSNYAELESEMNAFSNPYKEMETLFPNFSLQAIQQGISGTASILNTSIPFFYFCLPNNDKLLGYWDTVADRLFKIRHCQNIEGVEWQLALFEPPIDPALLVQAVAGGVDISSVLADLNSPLPYYRFNYILQKSLEICAELKSLGNSLLSALEKKDGETLSMMRTEHETTLLRLAKNVKELQINEVQRNIEGLEKTKEVTQVRYDFYVKITDKIPEELQQILELLQADSLQKAGQNIETTASDLTTNLPDIATGVVGTGGYLSLTLGRGNLVSYYQARSREKSFESSIHSSNANKSAINAGWIRRKEDWKLQEDLARKELAQIDKQILASQIRKQIVEQELVNHEQQLENAHQVQDFYRNKYTQEELYGGSISVWH